MKKIIYSLVLCFLLANVQAQQRYAYLPEGKTVFQTSYQKLIIKYKNELKIGQLSRFVTDSSLNIAGKQQKWNVFDIKNIYRNKDSLASILKALRDDSDVLYANPFLIYSDGTLEGLTNQLIVRLKTSTSIDSLSSVLFKQLQVVAIDKNRYIDREYILTINTKQQLDALDIADTLFETGLFDYCEPDFVKLGMFKTNDPVYNLQWGVHNTGQYNGTAGADINVVNAWNIATGAGIRVAVIDMGVDLNQPDLLANLLAGHDALGLGSNGAPTGDDAHGTACAGIIASVANNNIGVTGVAYSSRIIPVRVGINGTISTTAAVDGINWAASATGGNADILSCSWGGGSTSASLNTAIANAISNGRGGKGCIFLFSSGDANNPNILYPSNQPNVIAVGGTNMCDQRIIVTPTTLPNTCNYDTRLNTVPISGSSNYGTGLGVVAPGINIATTDISGAPGFSHLTATEGWIMFNQDYVENFDGTSASCAFTAGVMALILSVNPNLTYSQATAILESTADKVGGYNYSTHLSNGTWNNEMGYGRIDACAAIAQTLGGVLNISGDASFCSTTSNSYTIPNLPTGTTVTWSASPSYAVQVNSPNSNSTTLTKLTEDTVRLTATLSTACTANPVTISKYVVMGNPLLGTINQSGVLTPMNTSNSVSAGSALINFQWPGVTGISCYQSSTNPPVTQTGFIYYPSTSQFWFTLSSGQSITVSFSGTGCGSSVIATRSFNVGGHYYVISPNPASGTVTISHNTNSSMSKTEIGNTGIIQVSITDVNGILRKQQQFSANAATMQLNVSGLIPGTYFVQIINGDIHDTQQLIINR